MTLQQQLETRLQALQPVFLQVDNESSGHGGYFPGKESHFKVTLVSEAFAGLRLAQRHQRVYALTGELLSPADLTHTLETDGSLEESHFSIATARLLEDEVWGQGFPAPLFEDEFVVESQRILKEKHLKLRLRKGRLAIDAIQFNFSRAPGATVRAAYRLAINEYNGAQSTQLLIEHIDLPDDT